ncbi:hypothetical protein ACFLXN_01205 [Chloroflexota bacterium]
MSRFANNRQKGQALIWALILLVVGSLVIIPMLNYTTTAFRYVHDSAEKTVSEYSAEAAFEWAMWQLLHTDNVDVDENNPTWEGAIDINGTTIPIILSLVPLGEFIDAALPGVDVNYTIPAGHQLEMKLIVPLDVEPVPSFDHWFSYDTTIFPAQVYIPTPTGTLSFFWHNNPTPPTGDTLRQHPLPLDTTPPTAETLYNYDALTDNDPGILIKKGGSGPDENHALKMQEWITTPFAEPLLVDGKVGLLFWWGMKNFKTTFTAAGRFYLRDYDPVAMTYTEIGEITHVETEWARLFDFRSTCDDVTISGRIKLFSDKVEILSFDIE